MDYKSGSRYHPAHATCPHCCWSGGHRSRRASLRNGPDRPVQTRHSPTAELLVETDWLAAHLSDPAIRVVDLRPRGYEDGHIPGAVHPPNAATRDAAQAPSFVPLAADFQRTMTALGITNATRSSPTTIAAASTRRGCGGSELLRALERRAPERRMDEVDAGRTDRRSIGGRRSLQPEAPSAGTAGFVARPQPRWLATAPDVVDGIGKPGVKIVDAHATGEIEGRELRGARRGGIVPSAIPVWEDALDPNTRAFKPAPALAKLYLDRGVPEHEVIAYARSACAPHDLFTLHLLGYDKLRTYLGSWDEWKSRRPARRRREHREGFRRARIINGRGTPPLENATLIVENGRVTAAGPGASTSVPSGAEQIDVSGRTIVPGFINAHGHVGDTRDWPARSSTRGERARPARALRECGVTTVASLGGDREAGFALRVRSEQRHSIWRASWLRVRSLTRRRQRRLARKSTRLRQRSRTSSRSAWTTTSGPPRRCRWRPQCVAVVEQAHKHGLRAAAHIFYLEDAKALARAGVDMLAHGVRDKPVDDELIKLLKARDACVCPTLMREVSTFVYGVRRSFFRIRSSSDRPIRSCSRAPRSEAAGDRPHEPRGAGYARRSTSRPPISSASLTPASASRLAPTPARRRDSRGSSSTKSSR